MSVKTKQGAALTFWRGRTFSRTGTFFTDAANTIPKDLTGYSMWFTITGSDPERTLLSLAPGGIAPVGITEGTTGTLVNPDGTYLIYCKDTDSDALDETLFDSETDNAGVVSYKGHYQIVLRNPAGETETYFYGTLPLKLGAPLVVS